MTRRRALFATLLLMAALLTAPVAAVEEVHFENVYAFSAEATDKLTIHSVRLENLATGSTQTITLDAYGDPYVLIVTSWRDAGWMHFNVSCQYPDGHTEYAEELETFKPWQTIILPDTYHLNVQYYWQTYGSVLDTDVYAGLLPLSAQFYPQIPSNDTSYPSDYPADRMEIIAFSEVSGVSSCEISEVTLYYVTPEELQAVSENDLLLKWFHGVESLFSWTWDGVVYIVGKIPYVGVHLETFLVIVGFMLEEIGFWLYLFFIEYPELTFGAVEFLILADAIINTRSLWKLLQRIVDDHVKLAEFFIRLIVAAIDVMTRIITAVANAISTIKPF